MTVAESNDFMALEPRIVELVKQAVRGQSPAVHVLTADEIADVKEAAQYVPAVHVIYGGYSVQEQSGAAWILAHTWFVVATCRNSAPRGGVLARLSAGRLASLVMATIAGAQIPGAIHPLSLKTPPPSGHSGAFQYVVSAIEAETIFRKP